MLNRRVFVSVTAAACAVAAVLPTSRAWAWGRLGHHVSGRVAAGLLTPKAAEAVRAILEPGETLGDASTWADENRREHPEANPWHYVNVSIDEPRYDDRFCPRKGCVVSKIEEFRGVIVDPEVSLEKKRLALRFLIHFIEDIHQPLHVGHRADRGGNDLQVRFFDRGSNLHKVWDYELLERVTKDEQSWFETIDALARADEAAGWKTLDVRAWADESLDAAKLAYNLPDGSGTRLSAGAKLGDDYQNANIATAQKRVAQAAVRLAAVLNDAFDP